MTNSNESLIEQLKALQAQLDIFCSETFPLSNAQAYPYLAQVKITVNTIIANMGDAVASAGTSYSGEMTPPSPTNSNSTLNRCPFCRQQPVKVGDVFGFGEKDFVRCETKGCCIYGYPIYYKQWQNRPAPVSSEITVDEHSVNLLEEFAEELETKYQPDVLSSWPWSNLYTAIHNFRLPRPKREYKPVLDMLKKYRTAASRMCDQWAEGDQAVKDGLWRNLHALEADALDVIDQAEKGTL